MLKLDGIFPPLPTSFDHNEELALDKIQSNLERLSKFDLAGFLILGSNGEMVMLSDSEKRQVFQAAREAIRSDKLMLAGTGMQSTRETIALTRVAAECGADAVLVLNPSYYKGLMTRRALVAHYTAVADASPVPVIIYNMPACSGLDMDAATIIEIANHANIVGIKDSGGNIGKLGDVVRGTPPAFQFIVGAAGVLLPALAMGAVGGILALANIAPRQCLNIHRCFNGGDIERARAIQHQMIPINAAVTAIGGVPALKTAMDHLGLYGGPARKPILPLGDDDRQSLLNLLDKNDIKL
jgi:4-hydroxy-2-oxoglutarate aldolase